MAPPKKSYAWPLLAVSSSCLPQTVPVRRYTCTEPGSRFWSALPGAPTKAWLPWSATAKPNWRCVRVGTDTSFACWLQPAALRRNT